MRKVILLFALPLLATTYYVDKDGVHGTKGNDNYSGRSWQEPWATIAKAASTLTAGDSVIIARAVYRERIRPQNSGTSDNPIVYYGETGAVIAGSVPIDESKFVKVPGYTNLYAIHFPDFQIKGVVQLAGNDSIILRPYFDIAKSLEEVDDTAGSFLQRNDTVYIHTVDHQKPDSARHDLEFIRETFGIDLRGKSNLIFRGFTIRSQSDLGSAGFSIYLDNCRNLKFIGDTVIGGVIRGRLNSNILIDSFSVNRIWRISSPFGYGMLPHGMSGISFLSTDTLIIRNGEIWWQTDVANIDGDCDSVVIAESKWWGCPNHGVKITGSQSGPRPNNIIFHRCEAGAECQEAVYIYYADSILIENCDFNVVRQFYLESSGHSRAIRMVNTIITEKFWIAQSSINEYRTDYNCIYDPSHPNRFIEVGTTYYTLSEWQNLSGNDYHSLNQDPLVVRWGKGPGHPDSDFYLTKNSPCIDAGDPSYQPPPGGGPRIDIGAYEYTGPGISVLSGDTQTTYRVAFINPAYLPKFPNAESVAILDPSGRKIRQIKLGSSERVTIPPLPTGIYFYRYEPIGVAGKFIVLR
ncbi:hypothetical protein DRP53_01135 [candidate division WOR-3 bacterium]|uniref:Right handed beta helix domain-containing protein n=1 Tax=candidate division WOR-3 bacterium TaxID=2052148 RepID=A0A660SND3_UNCW3|nr:MAG: hypothetical protein DRP53_01135 [candidate division WOR-3 bacterium]